VMRYYLMGTSAAGVVGMPPKPAADRPGSGTFIPGYFEVDTRDYVVVAEFDDSCSAWAVAVCLHRKMPGAKFRVMASACGYAPDVAHKLYSQAGGTDAWDLGLI